MDTNDYADSSARPSRLSFRFILLALFFLTLVCVLLGFWLRPRQYVVESKFRISASPPSLLGESPSTFDWQEFELLRKTHCDLIRSDFVLMAALRAPGIAALPVLNSQDNQVQWLKDRLEVSSSGDSELLSIGLRCPEGDVEEYRNIVDAVSEAYLKEVVFDEEQRRLMGRDALNRSYDKLRKELVEKISDARSADNEANPQGPENVVNQLEIDVLREILRDMLRKLEYNDVNFEAPDRIRKVQSATSRPE